MNETPAVSLGASDVSLLELVNAYGTVINDGMVHDPVMVTRIEDKNGKIIYRHKQEQKQALPYETAFLMTQMLMAGLTEPMGTSQALWGYDLFRYNTDFGGKTGTSSNHSDAWFVGVTPNLVGGCWVGGEHRSIHFRTELSDKVAEPHYRYSDILWKKFLPMTACQNIGRVSRIRNKPSPGHISAELLIPR